MNLFPTLTLSCWLLGIPCWLSAQQSRSWQSPADSLMQYAIQHAPGNLQVLKGYDAQVSLSGKTTVERANRLMPYAYLAFPINKHLQANGFQLQAHTRYQAPNLYMNEILHIEDDQQSNYNLYREAFQLVNLNIYEPTLYNKQMIMPLSPDAFQYYSFSLVAQTTNAAGQICYDIRFTPRQWSQRLVAGNLLLNGEHWTVEEISLQGRATFEDYTMQIHFQEPTDQQAYVLPQHISLTTHYNCFGNRFTTFLDAKLDYEQVCWNQPNDTIPTKPTLDLTRYYTVSVPDKRPTDAPVAETDSMAAAEKQELSHQLTSPINLEYKSTELKYSGLFNPFQLSLGSGGVTYKQEVRLSKRWANGQILRFHPEVGYLFGDHAFRYTIQTAWSYAPRRMGELRINLSNTDQTFCYGPNPKAENTVGIQYYRHHIFALSNQFELLNGLTWDVGVEYHLHKAIHASDNWTPSMRNDFIPYMRLTYTPNQRYWFNEHEKEYLHTSFPTFRAEIARAIPGIMQSDSRFWRLEWGMNQTIPLGLTRKLNYNVSSGKIFGTRGKDHFVDFRFFAKKYFPEPWSDRFGGIFHNLDRDYYHASNRYVQLHVMLESPFILMQFMQPKLHRFIVSERFYWSHLWTPNLPKYGELGYGIGSDLLHAGLFVGFRHYKYENFGVKIAIDLFR